MGGFSHTQAEIRRGRWGFLTPVFMFQVCNGRCVLGPASPPSSSSSSVLKRKNAMQKQAEESKNQAQRLVTGPAQGK